MKQATLEIMELAGDGEAQWAIRVSDRLRHAAPGEAFVLRTPADPVDVLDHLQRECPNAFDWWPLEDGPRCWRVHVAKVEGDPDEPRTISDVMSADHVRLDHLYGQLVAAFEANDLAASRARLAEMSVALGRHCRAEERLLMPLLLEHGGPHGGKDAEQLHADHKRMTDDFVEAQAALDAGGDGAIAEARAALTDLEGVLRGHYRNEEHVLYPVADKAARKAGTRVQLIKEIQAT